MGWVEDEGYWLIRRVVLINLYCVSWRGLCVKEKQLKVARYV